MNDQDISTPNNIPMLIGMNITSKLALEAEMSPLVLVAYRQVFATLAIAPFAYWMEWKTRPQITMPIIFQIFLCSLTGALGSILIVAGLYSVLWGKTRETATLEGKETDANTKLDAVFKEIEKNDLELQLQK
ncbi:hypothetical protein ACLB2K_065062 [Fragaria x ananassa]